MGGSSSTWRLTGISRSRTRPGCRTRRSWARTAPSPMPTSTPGAIRASGRASRHRSTAAGLTWGAAPPPPLADAYFDSGRYQDFWAGKQAQLDDIVLDWVAGPAFDELLIQTVKSVYPAHEHDKFIAHLRGLLGLWVRDETARLAAA